MRGIIIDDAVTGLTNAIQSADGQNLEEILQLVARAMDLKHIAYVRFLSSGTRVLYAVVTYSIAWQNRYFDKNYVLIDPVINRGTKAVRPFDWERLTSGDPLVKEFFVDAKNYDVGRNGISLPIRDRTGGVSVVSFTSDHSREDWIDYKKHNMVIMQRLSAIINSAATISRQFPTAKPQLSNREEQCLELIARGDNIIDVAKAMRLSVVQVRCCLDTARHKLFCISVEQVIASRMK
jgi:DNA-binding CsgD family transcriptional regulator